MEANNYGWEFSKQGQIYKLDCFYGFGTVKPYQEYDDDMYFDIDDISPIPLTEEILLKCNIEDCGMAWSLSDEFDIILQESDNKGLWTLANVFVDSYSKSNYLCMGDAFQYVHQLQNLYFALTNTELEINL